jgi:putative membrane protein
MLVRDALLAYAHFISIFVLASVLLGEVLIYRRVMSADLYRRLRLVDRWYGVAAVLVLATGLARLFLGLKGVAFYNSNPVFWTKMALFAIVGLLSIAPTIAYIRWNDRTAADGSLTLGDAEYERIRRLLWVQVVVFAFIPLCATYMARGL